METGWFVSPSPPDLSLQRESCSEPKHKELRESRGPLEVDCVYRAAASSTEPQGWRSAAQPQHGWASSRLVRPEASVCPCDVTLDSVMGGLCPAGSELTLPHVYLVTFGVLGDTLCRGRAEAGLQGSYAVAKHILGKKREKAKQTEPRPLPTALM